MNTIQDVCDAYLVDNGIVKGPGKFEGQPPATVLMHDLVMNGFIDDEFVVQDTLYSLVNVDEDVRAAWDLDESTIGFIYWEDQYGFATGRELSAQQLEDIIFEIFGEDSDAGL